MTLNTDDFDEVAAWEKQTLGFDSYKTQLSRGKGCYRTDAVEIGELAVWRHVWPQRLYHEYAAPRGHVEFVLARLAGPGSWAGIELHPTSLFVHLGGRDYWSASPPGTSAYGFILPERAALDWGLVTDAFLAEAASPERAVAAATGPAVESFLRRADALLGAESEETRARDGVAAWYDFEGIMSGLQAVLDGTRLGGACSSSARVFSRSRLIDEARAHMSRHLELPLTSTQVAGALGVSRRGLERGFREALGVSPYQYLLVQKLHAVRRVLKEEETSVLGACIRYGFENTGRFAQMYARHFGELPSETSRRR